MTAEGQTLALLGLGLLAATARAFPAAPRAPLALLALWNGWKGYVASGRNLGNIDSPEARPFFARHRMWVKWTVPVWRYVAVTGWIIYLLLHNYGEVTRGG